MPLRRAGIPLLALARARRAGAGRVRRRVGGVGARPARPGEDRRSTRPSSAHFVLGSEDAPETGTALRRRRGRPRPAGLLRGHAAGAGARRSTLDLEVVSVDGTVYAQLPVHLRLQRGRPGPVRLRRPRRAARPGDRHLPAARRGARRPSWGRSAGSTARSCARSPPSCPASSSSRSSPAQDPEPAGARPLLHRRPTAASCAGPSSTGPFFAAEEDATFTLELSDFGADVEITAPPTG